MTINRNKKMPSREVCFTNIKLKGHRSIRANICYTVNSKNITTWVKQPIEFTFCDARHLAMRFHTIAKELDKQLAEFKRDLHGGNDIG
jgi:hypothetical protein